MNTLDVFVEKGIKIGQEKGRQEGRQEGRREKTENAVRNLVKASILTDEQIAAALEVTVDYVVRIRKELESEN